MDIMESAKSSVNEFFNLHIIYLKKDNFPFKEDSVKISVVTKSEILKYFNYIKKGKFDLQPIGNRQFNVVEPLSFHIYDFSKYNLIYNTKSRSALTKVLDDKFNESNDYISIYTRLGEDVTDSFGIRLEDILGESNIAMDVVTTETMTTTQKDDPKEVITHGKAEVDPQKSTIQDRSDISDNEINSTPYFPNNFSGGIIDNSVTPAFNVEEIARVFGNHLRNLKDENGQMVGVFGKWGRGKTYFVNKVCEHLKINSVNESKGEESDFILIKFQPWKYQSIPSTWAYLFETIINEYLNVGLIKKTTRIFRFSIARKGHFNCWIKSLLVIVFGLLWSFIFPFETKHETLNQIVRWTGGIGAFLILSHQINSFIKISIKPASNIFDSLSKVPSFNGLLGIQAEIQKELVSLIQVWSKIIERRRILLFIDDLDRCSEDKMIEIVDALRVMLDDTRISKHIVVLVAVDELILKKAVAHKYKERRNGEDLEILSEYLDKLFISAIKLPPISPRNRSIFIDRLVDGIIKGTYRTDNPLNHSKINIKPVNIDNERITDKELDGFAEKSVIDMIKNGIESTLLPLEQFERELLRNKVSNISKELTPRQIRIFFFRYLLARNLWLSLSEGIEFNSVNAINSILNQSYNATEQVSDTDEGLNEIVQMVVAY